MRGTACEILATAVRDGYCAAGPVQLITSIPVIENWADVLRRRLNYTRAAAEEKAWILREFALQGPLEVAPQIVVGSGHVPFATEGDVRNAAQEHLKSGSGKLFDEIADDFHVLLAAIAGKADILATADIGDFARGAAIRLVRDDVLLFPAGERMLVVAKPSFAAFWLRQGIVPDHDFVVANLDDFRRR